MIASSYFKNKNPILGINTVTKRPIFRLNEFFVSKEHPQLAYDMEVTENDLKHFQFMVTALLLPIRLYTNSPIIILSGKRSKELNHAVKGSKNSDHLYSCACDFTVKGFFNLSMVYSWISKNIPYYRQLIFYENKKFIHISINSPYNLNSPKYQSYIK